MATARPCGVYSVRYAQEVAVLRTRWQRVGFAALLVAVLAGPPLAFGSHLLSVLILSGITIVVMQGLNLLLGYCGQISLGQAAFMAVGAYTSANLVDRLALPFPLALLAAGLAASLIGLLVGLPALRVKGFYLAVTTLAAHSIIIWAALHGGNLTGTIYGLPVPPASVGPWTLDTDARYYVFTAIVVVLLTWFAKNLERTHAGRALVAVRDNDIAAETMGVNVFAYKLLAFFLCSFYAGVGGAMWAHYSRSIHPDQFPFIDSVWYLGFLVVGGMGSVLGPVFGSLLWRGLREVVAALVPMAAAAMPGFAGTLYSGLSLMLFALVIMASLILEPRGLNHRWQLLKASWRLWPFSH
ncbi:MAG: branched-chain amino acid ABC transporter permease [Gemmatimonadales bacterium]|nr:branched-chain amino acid ABC transporter permease [Gemmatimonadales bacterium]